MCRESNFLTFVMRTIRHRIVFDRFYLNQNQERMKRFDIGLLLAAAASLTATGTQTAEPGHITIRQPNAPELGYSPASGVKILTVNGLKFKDLDRDGELDPYEDWRLTPKERAADLASKLSHEEIAGLMLYSGHQPVAADTLTPPQRQFLTDDNLRHILMVWSVSNETTVKWYNAVQELCESLGHGIPANNSSDPRHGSRADAEFNAGGGGDLSMWPGMLGMAAAFSPELMAEFGRVTADEFRAMGLTTSLFPQVDVATDPRWFRFMFTMGEDPQLTTDLTRAWVDALQTSEPGEEIDNGWGRGSVNAMVKHWPGTGSAGEGGRDGHYDFGKYAVFPNGNFELHTQPFTEGAFKLAGPTKCAAAVMPDYTIAAGIDPEGIAAGFSKMMLHDILREKEAFDGVICTDWHITTHRPWGVERESEVDRTYRCLMAGVDMFGGNNDKRPVLAAFDLMEQRHGKDWTEQRIRLSARRLLLNMFRVGLFDNPYLDAERSLAVLGSPENMAKGYDAQLRSIIMLKNRNNTLPVKDKKKVYVPQRHINAYTDYWTLRHGDRTFHPVSNETLGQYFEPAATPEEADMAVVFIESPIGYYGYDYTHLGDTTRMDYLPVTLQYQPYTADTARPVSLAGDKTQVSANRSYRGRTVTPANADDEKIVAETRKAMGNKPVIVVANIVNPFVISGIEPLADAVLLTFDVQNQAVLDIISGHAEPSAMLPFQMPADMLTVEAQAEDTPRDMRPYTDSDGHTYDFGFGMNWNGPIADGRADKYLRK